MFTVSVGLLGVNVNVRRMWACHHAERSGDAAWYGGELAANSGRIEMAWRSFVDAMPNRGTARRIPLGCVYLPRSFATGPSTPFGSCSFAN